MLGCIVVIFKGEKAYKGEKVKNWKGEKMAAPFKGERVERWKGEKMANATNAIGLTP